MIPNTTEITVFLKGTSVQGHESSSSYQTEIVPFLTEHFKASLFEIQKGVTRFGHINIGEEMMKL